MVKKALLKAYVKAQVWASSVLEEARENLKDPRKKTATALALGAGMLTGSALAAGTGTGTGTGIGTQLSQTASSIICPIAQFITGPFAWGAILAAFVLGIASLAFGGRGAIRWMVTAFAAGILLIVGRAYFNNQVGNYGGCISK